MWKKQKKSKLNSGTLIQTKKIRTTWTKVERVRRRNIATELKKITGSLVFIFSNEILQAREGILLELSGWDVERCIPYGS